MPRFFCTQEVNKSISKYLKKDEYKTCKKDLCSFFSGKTIAVIKTLPILLSTNQDFYFIKSRVDNTSFNKGKSGGYRLYFYVDEPKDSVYLIGFYPKTGKHGRDDLTDTEVKLHIRSFANEKKSNTLIEYNIDDEFAIIEKKKQLEKGQ